MFVVSTVVIVFVLVLKFPCSFISLKEHRSVLSKVGIVEENRVCGAK